MSLPIEKINDYIWEIPMTASKGMRVPGRVYADEALINSMKNDKTLNQCINVAHLPGIQKYSITLPDGHQGYGFPIGGVAATDHDEGVISPGGVGYDINCGVRLLSTNLTVEEIEPKLGSIVNKMFNKVPSGLGSSRKRFKLNRNEFHDMVRDGVDWLIERDMGRNEDAEHCEEWGRMKEADPDVLSDRAIRRGLAQVGTLGSGNHFLEVQRVEEIFDHDTAVNFGLKEPNQVTLMIHTGSRGFGHQVCSDYLKVMDKAVSRYNIQLPDRELACAPAKSCEGEEYRKAMACAVNFAFCNRQAITHWVRESFEEVFGRPSEDMGMNLIYDVAHNIVKDETHRIDGKKRRVWTHRKGATRAFPPGSTEIPGKYRGTGQPVFIPGTMGTSSYVLAGTGKAMEKTFGSTPHGAGRVMSRTKAKRTHWGEDVQDELRNRGIYVMTASTVTLAEEVSDAYKDVERVVDVTDNLGIGKRVARMKPLAVVKG